MTEDGNGERRQRRGLPLAVLLSMALIVPAAVLVWVAGTGLRDARHDAKAAGGLIRQIETLEMLSGLYLPSAIEMSSLRGLARIDSLGVDRDVAAEYSGLDFDSYIGANRVRFDAALDALQNSNFETDGVPIKQRVIEIRRDLDGLRAQSASKTATDAAVKAMGAKVQALDTRLLEDLRQKLREEHSVSGGLVALAGSVDRAIDVVVRSSDELLAFFDWSLAVDAPPVGEVQHAATHQSAVVELFISSAVGDEGQGMAQLLDSVEYREWHDALEVDLPSLSGGVPAIEEQWVSTTTKMVQAHIAYYTKVDEAIRSAMRSLVTRAKEAERDATRVVRNSILMLIVTFLSVAFAGFIIRRRVVAPLRRLARSAERVSRGVMPSAELTVAGPAETRAATRAFNELVASVGQVNSAVDDLAQGRLSGSGAAMTVSGPIGQSLRQSVRNLSDLTDRLQRSEALATAIITTAADAIWTVDQDGNVLSANEAAEELLGAPADRQVGWRLRDFLVEGDGEALALSASGEPIPVLVSSSVVDAGGERIHTVFARNIAERRQLERQLEFQARHDSLTLLPNRSAALERIAELLEKGAEEDVVGVAVLFIDLDGFKAVNDTLGHGVGDYVVRVAASRLRGITRDEDFAARLGGDEFVLISERPPSVEAMVDLGRRLIAEFERPVVWEESSFTISASVGVAMSTPADLDALELIRRADDATYLAKSRGRGRVEEYNAALQAKIEEQSSTELALRQGVREGELSFYLQPIVDLRSGRFVGVESLTRWPRTDGRTFGAGHFIPIAERSSLITEIGQWTLNEACRTLRRWSNDELLHDLSISVNISGRHLMDERVIDHIDEAIDRFGVDPKRLHVELTETHILTDLDRARETLGAFAARGLSIAVDDFGAGYASMTYLREFPAKIIKLDQRFISRAQDDRYDEAIVVAMIGLGAALDMLVVAEGVETRSQLDFVRRVGCAQAQGYFLAQPMPAEQMERWLRDNGARAWPAVSEGQEAVR